MALAYNGSIHGLHPCWKVFDSLRGYMNKECENCGKEHNSKYGSGRFCTSTCARSFSTKEKRIDINENVSKKLTINIEKLCPQCQKVFKTVPSKNGVYCSSSCFSKFNWSDEEYKNRMTNISKKRCEPIEEKIRMREIGKMGGFGKKGYTENGTYYQSTLEQKCFEYLELNKIAFIPHKNIPNSSKISDVYLLENDMWIEIDGINREKRKKWLGENYVYWLEKLEIYKIQKLNIKIIKNLAEFKQLFINN